MNSPIKVTTEDFEGTWYRIGEELEHLYRWLGQLTFNKSDLEKQLKFVNSEMDKTLSEIELKSTQYKNMGETIDKWQSEGKYDEVSEKVSTKENTESS